MKNIIYICLVGFLFIGCQSVEKGFVLSPQALQERQMQTRRYETNDEMKVLSACAELLQDTGFAIDESETKLGMISASKMKDATDGVQVTFMILAALGGSTPPPIDKEQKMKASIVTRPTGKNNEFVNVRVTFQRIVWNTHGQVTKAESIIDSEAYQIFFSKLSKSIFLEAHQL